MPFQAGDIDPLRRLSCRRSYESYNPASDRMDALLPTTLSRGQYGTKVLCCTARISLQRMTSALDQAIFFPIRALSILPPFSSSSPHASSLQPTWLHGHLCRLRPCSSACLSGPLLRQGRDLSKNTYPLRSADGVCTEAYAGATPVIGSPMGPMSISGPCSTFDTKLWRIGKTAVKGRTLAELRN